MMEYRTATGNDDEEIDRYVQELINEGWRPLGGVCVTAAIMNGRWVETWAQAMVRDHVRPWMMPTKDGWPIKPKESNDEMSKLNAQRLNEIFLDSLFRDGERTNEYVAAHGIVSHVGFHPERLQSHRDEVSAMLSDLPQAFHENTGGGWSFLQACVDRDGVQWGEHINMEQLFLLGVALRLVRECVPRAMWSILPGGMPYYVVVAPTPEPAPPESAP